MKEQLAGAEFSDGQSTYTFDKTADHCAMTYSGGTANFTMTYDEDKKQCTMQDKKYNKGVAMTYGYSGDPKAKVTLSLVSPVYDPENPWVPETINLTRTNA